MFGLFRGQLVLAPKGPEFEYLLDQRPDGGQQIRRARIGDELSALNLEAALPLVSVPEAPPRNLSPARNSVNHGSSSTVLADIAGVIRRDLRTNRFLMHQDHSTATLAISLDTVGLRPGPPLGFEQINARNS
jgi:hypothetical protein